MTPIVDEGLQTVVSHTTLGASRRAGRQLLVVLPHIGPPGDQPAEHQSEAHPIPTATNINRLFADLTDAPPDAGAAATADAAPSRFARIRPILLTYIMLVFIAIRLDGTSLMQGFEDLLDLSTGYGHFEAAPFLAVVRQLCKSMAQTAFTTSTQLPDVLAAAPRAPPAAAAGNVNVTSHKPSLPEVPADAAEHLLYQWLTTLRNTSSQEKTHTALQMALKKHTILTQSWMTWLAMGPNKATADGTVWDSNDEVGHVDGFLDSEIACLSPASYARRNRDDALSYRQQQGQATSDYFKQKHQKLELAQLTLQQAKSTHPQISNTAEWPRLAQDGLTSVISDVLDKFLSDAASNGTLKPGMEKDHFTEWKVMTECVENLVLSRKLDTAEANKKPAATSNASGAGQPSPANSTRLDRGTYRQLRANRQAAISAFTAAHSAEDYLINTSKGQFFMVEADYLLTPDGQPISTPIVDVHQAYNFPLPPLLVDQQGNKAPPNKQLCKVAWAGQQCRFEHNNNPKTGKKCEYLHKSKDEFYAEAQSGTQEFRPAAPRAPPMARMPAHPAALPPPPPTIPSPSTQAPANQDQMNTAVLQGLRNMEGLLTRMLDQQSGTDASQTSRIARARASMAGAAQSQQEEEAAIASLQASYGMMVDMPTMPATPPTHLHPEEEAFWENDVTLTHLAIMLSKVDPSAYLESHTNAAGQPCATLYVGDIEIEVMFDTGCTPAGLMSLHTYLQLRERLQGNTTLLQGFRKFNTAKVISGVAKDTPMTEATQVVGCARIMLRDINGRDCPVWCGLMVRGSTGLADVMVGNWTLRHEWNFVMDKDQIDINTPPDGGSPFTIPLRHSLHRVAMPLFEPKTVASSAGPVPPPGNIGGKQVSWGSTRVAALPAVPQTRAPAPPHAPPPSSQTQGRGGRGRGGQGRGTSTGRSFAMANTGGRGAPPRV